MFAEVKKRCGIHESITVYDDEISGYIDDAIEEMIDSGVSSEMANSDNAQVMTAITCYVKSYIGDDRNDSAKYMKSFRNKVFRVALKSEEVGVDNVE